MLRTALHNLVVTLVVIPALAVQVPLSSAYHGQAGRHLLGNEEWSLDRVPNPNATDHLVFETVSSFLQHWPNTRMRNGRQPPLPAFLNPLSYSLLQAITSYQEVFRKEHFCTMER